MHGALQVLGVAQGQAAWTLHRVVALQQREGVAEAARGENASGVVSLYREALTFVLEMIVVCAAVWQQSSM